MSTKSTIQTLINTNLASASSISAVEHRAVVDSLLNELFPATTNYTLATGDFQYNLNFTKSGNFCLVQGFFKNGSAFSINGENLFTIPNSLYYPKVTVKLFGFLSTTPTGKGLYLGNTGDAFAPNQFKLLNGIGAGDILQINSIYIVND